MIHYLRDFHWQWTWVVLFGSLLLSAWIKPRFGCPAALLFFYSALSAVWVWVVAENRYLPVNTYDQMALRYFACDSIAKFCLIALPIMLFAKDRRSLFLWAQGMGFIFLTLNSLIILWQSRLGCSLNNCGGMIGNPSISLGMSVCLMAAICDDLREQWKMVALVAVTAILSQSSVAIGLLGVYALLLMWRHYRRVWVSSLAFALVFAAGKVAAGHELTNNSDRFRIWSFMFERWRAPWNILAGTGLGTYHVFSINLQNIPGREPLTNHDYWWNTLHNDLLQMLFECGVVGLSLFLFAYCSALFRMIRKGEWNIATSILLFGAYMLLDPALHNPVPALFGAWLFAYALRRKHTIEEYL